MLDQSFSAENLLRVLSIRDLIRFNIRGGKEECAKIALAAAEKVKDVNYEFSPFYQKKANGKQIYSASTIQDQLIINKLNDNLRRLYKVRQANRDAITRQVHSLLQEALPVIVLRTDVSGFYENISGSKILSFLDEAYLLSPKSKHLLDSLFSSPNLVSVGGLPRGISLSATLSEIYMRRFDKSVKDIEGVYYYARFVDDIIVFDFKNEAFLLDKVKSCLPEGLSLNPEKTFFEKIYACRGAAACTKIKCKCKYEKSKYRSIEYLGYKYDFPDIVGGGSQKDSPRPVEIGIAKQKLKKIKTRIIKAILDYSKIQDFSLLRKRIMYITGNRVLRIGGKKDSRLKTGISYNYRLLSFPEPDLVDLDIFLRKALTSKNGWLGKKLAGKLTALQCQELFKLSFQGSYRKRISHNFKAKELGLIKRCWKK